MPAPVGRDLGKFRTQLEAWFPTVLPDDASHVKVGEIGGPGGTGFSSDTVIFDLDYRSDGRDVHRGLVVRIQPTGFQIFPEYDLPAQYNVMKALRDTAVPVPTMLWQELTGDVIGSTFYVMEKIEGLCPADNPSYTVEGWLKEMSAEGQAELWQGYIETLAKVHALDPVELKRPMKVRAPRLSRSLTARTKLIIDQLDEQGRWVENGRLRDDEQDAPSRKVIDCRTFISNVNALSTYLTAIR